MALYLLKPSGAGTQKAKALAVSAANEAGAKAAASAYFGGDSAWSGATVTALADVASNADDALLGYRFGIIVKDADGEDVAVVEVVGTATDDNIDEIAALLVAALLAVPDTPFAGAAYNSSTQALTVATGAGGDDLGDHSVIPYVYGPAVNDDGGQRRNEDVNLPGFMTVAAHEGAATDPLTITMAADTFVVPRVVAVV